MSELFKSAEELPGSYGLPVVGEALQLFNQQQGFYWERFERYGSIFKTKIFQTKIACLIQLDATQIVLENKTNKFYSNKAWQILEPLLGEILLSQDGKKHQSRKKIMYPAFCGEMLREYYKQIQETTDFFLINWINEKNILVFHDFKKLTLLIACKLFITDRSEEEINRLSLLFSEIIEGIRTIIRWNIPLIKFGRAIHARRQLEAYLRSVIAQRRQKKQSDDYQDVLDLLIHSTDEKGDKISETEIISQSLGLLFAAHENIAKLLSWCLFELEGNPKWLGKLRQEQKEISFQQSLDFFHLQKLIFMDYVLKEVERLYPPVYTIPRAVKEDFHYCGYLIPKDWFVIISPLLIHRSVEIYQQPDKFDPLRFAPERAEDKKHPFALIGFGGGTHKCLGIHLAKMEMKIILSTILKNYDWEISPNYAEISPVRQATKKIEEKMLLKVTPLANHRPTPKRQATK